MTHAHHGPDLTANAAGYAERYGRMVQLGTGPVLTRFLGEDIVADLDLFDRVQLAEVLRVCVSAKSLSDAGRTLFAQSRKKRSSVNDADRVRKYLAKYGLGWEDFA